MRMTDALPYLPFSNAVRGTKHTPETVMSCAMPGCFKTFPFAYGKAFAGSSEGVVNIYFFCSEACYLTRAPICGHG